VVLPVPLFDSPPYSGHWEGEGLPQGLSLGKGPSALKGGKGQLGVMQQPKDGDHRVRLLALPLPLPQLAM
jgi:hypothetical protein